MRILYLAVLVAWMSSLHAQDEKTVDCGSGYSKSGRIWAMWGYNRAHYNRSDVHYSGDGFDFTLTNAEAHDLPEPWDPSVYLHPLRLTIPQFNFRMGYYLNERVSVSAGWDHMKYRLVPWQLVRIDGYIDPQWSELWGGTYDNGRVFLDPSFMTMEHSDGFNFVRVGLDYHAPVWCGRNGKVKLDLVSGAFVGLMFPWTDFTFFGNHYRNRVHLSGYGVSATSGFRVYFFDHFFIHARAQYGWSNLTDITIMNELSARAQQQIVFFERSIMFGGQFKLFNNRD